MEAVSSVFGGILKLWAYAVFVVIPLVALGSACVYFAKHPRESIGIVFWTLFPYVLGSLIFFLLQPFIGPWSIIPAVYAWGKAQAYSIDLEQKELKAKEEQEKNSEE